LAGQNDVNGISYGANALGLNGGTLLDGTGNAAVITASARTDNSNYKVDTTAPTVTVGSDKASLLAGQTAAITFTFSEDPGASFDAADITLSNGTLSTLSGVGLTRSATFTPTANLTSGNGSVAVNVGSYQDAAGNVGAAGSSDLITLDTAAPTVLSLALNAASTGLLNSTFNAGDVAVVEVVFSETVTVVTTGGVPTLDLTIGSTVVKAAYASGTGTNSLRFSYTIVTGQTDIDGIAINLNGLVLNGGIITDLLGNTATVTYAAVTNDSGYKVDTTAPTPVITASTSQLKVSTTATLTFTFLEAPVGFELADIVATNGTVTSLLSPTTTTRTAVFTPTSNLDSTSTSISLTPGSYTDAAGNAGTAGTPLVVALDTKRPTVTIGLSDANISTGETSLVTFTFSEDMGTSFVWNGTSGDVSVTGGTLSAISGTGLSRTATFTPTASTGGTGSISVTGANYSDLAGNTGSNASSATINIDTAAPTITSLALNTAGSTGLLSSTFNAGDLAAVAVVFNEAITVGIAGGVPTLSMTIGSTVVTADYVSGSGTTTLLFKYTILAGQTDTDGISLNANGLSRNGGTLKDAVGNAAVLTYAAVANASGFLVDTTAPTLSITSSKSTVLADETATITFTFSEVPSGFALGDIVATNGTMTSLLSPTTTTRTAVFTPTAGLASTSSSITVTSGTYTDLAGNNGGPGTSPSVTVNTFKNRVYLSDILAGNGGYTLLNTTDFTNGTLIGGAGYTISNIGDFNNDGFDDFITGSPVNSITGKSNAGLAVVVMGARSLTVGDNYTFSSGYGARKVIGFSGHLADAWAGTSVSGIGDLNRDGYADVIIGAQSTPGDSGTTFKGAAYVEYGRSTSQNPLPSNTNTLGTHTTDNPGFTISGYEYDTGFAVSGAGDVNGDGWLDLLVSAHFATANGNTKAGKTYVVFGKKVMTNITLSSTFGGIAQGFVINGAQANEESGTSVSSAGDFNGDGLADLLIGAYFSTANGLTQAGNTYVVFGKTTGTAVDLAQVALGNGGFVIKGDNAYDLSGVSVSSGGDINGDGYADLLIGAHGAGGGTASGANTGASYVVFGRATMPAGSTGINLSAIAASGVGAGGFAIISDTPAAFSGHSISSAGDINGDGLMDIILSAPAADPSVLSQGGINSGLSYVIYGKTSTTAVNLSDVYENIGGFAIVGDDADQYSGWSVSAAGDINGDGLADLLVGAPGVDRTTTHTNTGMSYVIYGATTGPFAAGNQFDNTTTTRASSTGSHTSSGNQSFYANATANGVFNASGADVLYGSSMGDRFVIGQPTITALQNVYGAGGNTTQLSRISGGNGVDEIWLKDGATLDLTLIKDTPLSTAQSTSRISSVEVINMANDTSANTLKLRVSDVLDTSSSNWMSGEGFGNGTSSGSGWANRITTYDAFSQMYVKGTSNDSLSLVTGEWTKQSVTDAFAYAYSVYAPENLIDIYLASNGTPAMLAVSKSIVVTVGPA
jgi:hypothetical protein